MLPPLFDGYFFFLNMLISFSTLIVRYSFCYMNNVVLQDFSISSSI